MDNSVVHINKEQYALRKLNKDIALTSKLLSEIVDKLPKEYFEKGEYHFDRNEFREALQWYSKAIEHKPDFAMAYCKRAYSYLNVEEYYLAISDFDKAISFKSNYNDALFGRANAKIPLKDYEGAISDFSKAILSEPKDDDAYFFRGLLKEETGDIKGALEDWVKAGTNGSKHAKNVLENKMNKTLKKIELNYNSYYLIEHLTNQIEEKQNDGSLYLKRGLEKANLNDYKNAISDFQKANYLNGNDKAVLNNIGRSFFNLGNELYNAKNFSEATANYADAIRYCDKAIELDRGYASAYLIRGASKRMLADKNGACLDFQKAHELGDRRAIGFINEYCV